MSLNLCDGENLGDLAITRRLGGQATIIFLGNLFTLAVGFPLQVYVARVLGAEGLGTFSLLEGGVATLSGFLAFGIAPTLVRFIPEHLEKREYGSIRKLLRGGALILAVAGSLAYLLLLLALPWLDDLWPEIAHHGTAIAVMGVLVPIGLLLFFLQQGLRGFQEIRYMVLGSSVLQLTIKAVLTIVLFALGLKLMGYVAAVVAAAVCAVFWMFLGLRRKVRLLPGDGPSACEGRSSSWRRYATVMFSVSLLGVGSQHLDRFLLGFFAGTGAVGVLAVVKQLQQLPAVFLRMFLTVCAPMFAAAHARGDQSARQQIYHLTTDWMVRAALPLLLFLALFGGPLLALFGPEFAEEGMVALWILVAAQVVNLTAGPVGHLLNMSGLENKMLKLTAYQSALTACGLLVLVPAYGLIGGALSLAVAIVFMNVGALILARRHLRLRWWDKRYLRWGFPTAATLAVGMWLASSGASLGALELAGCLPALYAIFFGVSLAQGLHADDRELLRHLRGRLRGIAARRSV